MTHTQNNQNTQKTQKVIFLGAYAKLASDATSQLNVSASDNAEKLGALLPAFFACAEISVLCIDILF